MCAKRVARKGARRSKLTPVEKPADWRFRYYVLRLSETHGLDHDHTHTELDRLLGQKRAKGLVACEVEAGDAAFREMRFRDTRQPSPGAPVMEIKRHSRPKTYGLTAFGHRLAAAFLADVGEVARVRGYLAEMARAADEAREREFQAARKKLRRASAWAQAFKARETAESLRTRMDARLAIAITDAGCPQTVDDLVLWGFVRKALARDLSTAVEAGALVVVGKGLYDVPARAPGVDALPPYLSERVLVALGLGAKPVQQMALELGEEAADVTRACVKLKARGVLARVSFGIYALTEAGQRRLIEVLERQRKVLARRAQLLRLARVAGLSKRMGLEGDPPRRNVRIVRRAW